MANKEKELVVVIKAETVEEAINEVKEDYKDSEVCLDEMLEWYRFTELNIKNVVTVYASLYMEIEDDGVYHTKEYEINELWSEEVVPEAPEEEEEVA